MDDKANVSAFLVGVAALLMGVGTFGVVHALNMDTTVEVPGQPSETIGSGEFSIDIPSVPAQRVHNIGLMEERRTWLILSGLALIVGVLCLGISALTKDTRGNNNYPR